MKKIFSYLSASSLMVTGAMLLGGSVHAEVKMKKANASKQCPVSADYRIMGVKGWTILSSGKKLSSSLSSIRGGLKSEGNVGYCKYRNGLEVKSQVCNSGYGIYGMYIKSFKCGRYSGLISSNTSDRFKIQMEARGFCVTNFGTNAKKGSFRYRMQDSKAGVIAAKFDCVPK